MFSGALHCLFMSCFGFVFKFFCHVFISAPILQYKSARAQNPIAVFRFRGMDICCLLIQETLLFSKVIYHCAYSMILLLVHRITKRTLPSASFPKVSKFFSKKTEMLSFSGLYFFSFLVKLDFTYFYSS